LDTGMIVKTNQRGTIVMAAPMRRRIAIPALLCVIGLVLVMSWPDKKMISRDIGCANIALQRGKEICHALSDSMEWTWMGHAIISPGWRVTWNALRRVYCSEKISAVDLTALEAMKMGSDWRLQSGADDLVRLVGSSSGGPANEPENSIFNPTNPNYLLKDGCVGDQ
jgi:hypothetical protein